MAENTILLGFITAFFIVLLATPSLIKVAKLKHLVDEPGEDRKIHRRSIPTIGGIIIFGSVLFTYALWYPESYSTLIEENDYFIKEALTIFKYLTACLILLFFVGIKDDIIGTAPLKKLLAHMLVGFILVMMGGIKIDGMHGIFGVGDFTEQWPGVLLSVFVYIVVVNAYNLIDGVDGLAAGIGIISSFCFGVVAVLMSQYDMAVIAFSLIGVLFGFLKYNLRHFSLIFRKY